MMNSNGNSMENQPLLEELGHHELLSMITPEEVKAAQKTLAPFLKEYKAAGVEKVAVLAYLFGVKQGIQEMYSQNAGKCLSTCLIDVNYMGKLQGFMEAILLFGNVVPFPLSILKRTESPIKSDETE